MNIRKDTKNLQAILDKNRTKKNGESAIKEFHKMHEYIIKLEAKVENLALSDVGESKRFAETDLLNTYQAGCIEGLDECCDLGLNDLKEIKEDGKKWIKRYVK